MKTYTITVTAQVAQIIINALSDQPYKIVSEAMNVVSNQITIQNNKKEEVEPATIPKA